MLPVLYGDRIATPRGVFSVIFSNKGIYEIYFPGRIPKREYPQQKLSWLNLADDLKDYLAGQKADWTKYPLDTSGYRPFTAALLEQVRQVPHGQVLTYREVAEKAGFPKAWRAAGQALKANRHPIIVPCHRIVAAGGRLGGFSGPEGWKQMLLELEGAL